jgi:predicted RNase H-like nuclease
VVNDVRLLGLDLAWSAKNPSGLAVLDRAGRLLHLSADLRSDDEILEWIARWRGSSGVLGFDMPTIVRNAQGRRDCERDLAADFRRYHAGPYPANLGLAPFAGGGRARRLIDAIGAEEDPFLGPRDPRTIALEVFPHAAHVRLFDLPRIFQYKQKPQRPHLTEWARYRAALATLAQADPPLQLGADVPTEATARSYKAWDDKLDAITCAYVALVAWRYGAAGLDVYGDTAGGYIVVPKTGRVWAPSQPGTTPAWTR